MAVAMDNIRGNANQLKGITSTEPLKTSEDTKSPSQSTAPERNDLHLMALPQELQDIIQEYAFTEVFTLQGRKEHVPPFLTVLRQNRAFRGSYDNARKLCYSNATFETEASLLDSFIETTKPHTQDLKEICIIPTGPDENDLLRVEPISIPKNPEPYQSKSPVSTRLLVKTSRLSGQIYAGYGVLMDIHATDLMHRGMELDVLKAKIQVVGGDELV